MILAAMVRPLARGGCGVILLPCPGSIRSRGTQVNPKYVVMRYATHVKL